MPATHDLPPPQIPTCAGVNWFVNYKKPLHVIVRTFIFVFRYRFYFILLP